VAGPTVARFTVDRSTHPQFADHTIDGTPVVPVVQVLEWFARSAIAHAPHLHLTELSRVQVLKGLVATGFHAGESLEVVVSVADIDPTADTLGGDTLFALELVDPVTGRKHYRCTARMTPERVAPDPSPFEPVEPAAVAAPWPSPVYSGDVLFHGPAFQVLHSVGSLTTGAGSTTGLAASATGVIERRWPGTDWATDPAMLDGGLQLALLWTERLLGGPSLPTSIGRVRVFTGPIAEVCTATLVGREATASKVTCDVVFRDGAGRRVAELIGVETHLLPRRPA
jgi:hypothetical protein